MKPEPNSSLTEKHVQNALWNRLRDKGHCWICPNYTPPSYWECDIFSLTKAGFFVEHEIKMTVSDFKADARKQRTSFDKTALAGDRWSKKKKHDMVQAPAPHTPTRFYYCAPQGVLTLDMIPTWAGLVEFWLHTSGIGVAGLPAGRGIRFHELKAAPKLHATPFPEAATLDVGRTFYWRYWYGVRRVIDHGAPNDYDI